MDVSLGNFAGTIKALKPVGMLSRQDMGLEFLGAI
jgi:hypothetical protein